MIPVVFTPAADADLDRIWADLALLSELAATNVTLRLTDACLSLSDLPRRHPIERRVRGGLTRQFNVERYVILYEVNDAYVEIIRVLPGEMDLDALLLR